jgi:CHASE3 domain sensor protein
MGNNTFWFYEREDGEWINFELDDIDAQMRKAGAYFVDEDMRLQRLGIAKNLAERLIKETFWQKYGTTIMLVIFCLVVTICLVVLFQKMQGNWQSAKETAVAIEHMASATEQMAKNMQASGVKLA